MRWCKCSNSRTLWLYHLLCDFLNGDSDLQVSFDSYTLLEELSISFQRVSNDKTLNWAYSRRIDLYRNNNLFYIKWQNEPRQRHRKFHLQKHFSIRLYHRYDWMLPLFDLLYYKRYRFASIRRPQSGSGEMWNLRLKWMGHNSSTHC